MSGSTRKKKVDAVESFSSKRKPTVDEVTDEFAGMDDNGDGRVTRSEAKTHRGGKKDIEAPQKAVKVTPPVNKSKAAKSPAHPIDIGEEEEEENDEEIMIQVGASGPLG